MNKHAPAIALSIASIALLIAYINANQTVRQLRKEVEQLKTSPVQADTSAESAAPPGDPATTPAGTAAVESAAALEPAGVQLREVESRERRMMENIAKMMENPTMNKVMEASQRGAVGALYTDLIEYLNLDADETKYFMDLLMYRHMKQVDMSMKMMSGSLSDEEKKVLEAEIGKAADLVKEQMKNFLNNDADYAEFEYYEKTMGERMMLSQMDKDLAGTGAALPDATYRELLGVMHDERSSFDFTSNLHDQENPDLSPERFSRQNLDNYAKDIRNLNDAICRKAEAILTPEQYQAFVASLKTFTDMQLAQLEMAAQMFGGGQ